MGNEVGVGGREVVEGPEKGPSGHRRPVRCTEAAQRGPQPGQGKPVMLRMRFDCYGTVCHPVDLPARAFVNAVTIGRLQGTAWAALHWWLSL